jgi:hypothetical protein
MYSSTNNRDLVLCEHRAILRWCVEFVKAKKLSRIFFKGWRSEIKNMSEILLVAWRRVFKNVWELVSFKNLQSYRFFISISTV